MERVPAWVTGLLLGILAFFTVAGVCYLPLRLFYSKLKAKAICVAICTWIVAIAVIALFTAIFAFFFEPGWYERLRADDSYMVWAVSAPFDIFQAALDRNHLWIVFFVLVFAMASLIMAWFGALFVVPSVLAWAFTVVGMYLWATRILPRLDLLEGREEAIVGYGTAGDPRWNNYRRD